MTQLEKAQAVIAAFNGEVECPSCHEYVLPIQLWTEWKGGLRRRRVCPVCWRLHNHLFARAHVSGIDTNGS